MSFSKRWVTGLLILLALGVPWGAPRLGSAGTAISAATAEVQATPEPAPAPVEVTFRGENDLLIRGVWYPAPRQPASTLLLLNFRHSWSAWAPRWTARGFNVVAIDELIYNVGGLLAELNRQDIHNIQHVIQQLNDNSDVIPHQFAILGGSLMGGYALMGCATSPDCRLAILLSPTDTAVDIPDPMAALGDRAVVLVASKGEFGIAETTQKFADQARGDHLLLMYDWGFHASAMLIAHPELVDTIGDWLVKYLPSQF